VKENFKMKIWNRIMRCFDPCLDDLFFCVQGMVKYWTEWNVCSCKSVLLTFMSRYARQFFVLVLWFCVIMFLWRIFLFSLLGKFLVLLCRIDGAMCSRYVVVSVAMNMATGVVCIFGCSLLRFWIGFICECCEQLSVHSKLVSVHFDIDSVRFHS
jgi:hypothetical protein